MEFKKKTMLVRELVHDPDVLILDEPTGYMDAESIRETWDLLKELKGHKTIIYVSNALAEIEQAHDRIMVFHEGRILMDGHLDKLLESTLDYHQFQIEFENLTDELFKKLTNVVNELEKVSEYEESIQNIEKRAISNRIDLEDSKVLDLPRK